MAKFTGRGAELLLDTGTTTPSYRAIGQIAEIGDIAITSDEVEVTTLDTVGGFRDFIQGFKDAGECEINVMSDPALADQDDSADGLLGIFQTGEDRDWAIRYNSSGAGGESFLLFRAFIRDWTFGALNPDDPQSIKPVLRLKSDVSLEDALPTTRAAAGELSAAQANQEAKRLADRLAKAQASAKVAEAGAADRAKALEALRQEAAQADAKAKKIAADECTKIQQLAAQAAQQAQGQQFGQLPR